MKITYSYIDKAMSRFIFAKYTDDSKDKYTRVYITNDRTLKHFESGKCEQIAMPLYHLSKREKQTIIESYCSGYENGINTGRQQIKDELKRIFT